MNKTIFTLSLVITLSSASACLAADQKGNPANNIEKDASNAIHALGTEVDKTEHAVAASIKNVGKDNHKPAGSSPQSSALEKNASGALNTLGTEADKAEHAIAGTINGVTKNNSANRTSTSKNDSAPSFNQSLDEFGKNANKVGAAMQKSMNNMGKQADEQIHKGERSMSANSKKPQNAGTVRQIVS